jgi:hypothetical protein
MPVVEGTMVGCGAGFDAAIVGSLSFGGGGGRLETIAGPVTGAAEGAWVTAGAAGVGVA